MTFSMLPPGIQALQCIWNLLLIVLLGTAIIQSLQLKFSAPRLLLSGALILVLLFILQCCVSAVHAIYDSGESHWLPLAGLCDRVPFWIYWLVLLTASVYLILWDMRISRVSAQTVGLDSLRAMCDDLPTALCYYYPSGKILLVNRRMNELSETLFGHPVLNGAEFSESLHKILDGHNGMLTIEGIRLLFSSRELMLGEKEIVELTASDISEEYELNRQLAENNKKLEEQRDRYRKLSSLIEQMTVQKEILAAKTRVHDELGSTLLAARRYLEGNQTVSGSDILRRCKENIAVLRGSTAVEEPLSTYDRLFKAAEDVGVSIKLNGRLPQDPAAEEVLSCAIHECMTNTIRHAHGDELTIDINQMNDYYVVHLRNNGQAPAGPVSESGGLGNLRRMTEHSGGMMFIETEPAFAVKLIIPSGREN